MRITFSDPMKLLWYKKVGDQESVFIQPVMLGV